MAFGSIKEPMGEFLGLIYFPTINVLVPFRFRINFTLIYVKDPAHHKIKPSLIS